MSLSISRFGLALVTLGAGCMSTDDDLDSDEGLTVSGNSNDALTAVTGFGSNPGALKMFTYSPAGVGADAPLVVAMHGCTQSAQEYVKAGWNQLADTWKFHVLYPEQQTANSSLRCFNWFEAGDTQRNQGEALSIKQMVDWAIANLSVDPDRVYATGLSAGAAMVPVLLAVYPDVFAGGAILGGMPFKCAQNQNDMTKCTSPGVDRTPQGWGDLARTGFPGYAGRLPNVSIWHGTNDTIVRPMNMGELVDQWTNVHGIDATADATWTINGATRKEYRNAQGETVVETYSIPNMGHGTPVDPGYAPAGGCGSTSSYILDVNVCSSYQIGLFFELDGGSAGGSCGAGGSGGAGGRGGSGGAPPATCEEFYDANYFHVTKGRAKQCGLYNSYVCALGSNDNLGLFNLHWNGKLVVAGTPGTRSEFANEGTIAPWILKRGYAYVSGNKGMTNAGADGNATLLSKKHPTRHWGEMMLDLATWASARLAEVTCKAPEHVYAVGLSNGGYQVRRALEIDHAQVQAGGTRIFSGGLDWAGAHWPDARVLDKDGNGTVTPAEYAAANHLVSTNEKAALTMKWAYDPATLSTPANYQQMPPFSAAQAAMSAAGFAPESAKIWGAYNTAFDALKAQVPIFKGIGYYNFTAYYASTISF